MLSNAAASLKLCLDSYIAKQTTNRLRQAEKRAAKHVFRDSTQSEQAQGIYLAADATAQASESDLVASKAALDSLLPQRNLFRELMMDSLLSETSWSDIAESSEFIQHANEDFLMAQQQQVSVSQCNLLHSPLSHRCTNLLWCTLQATANRPRSEEQADLELNPVKYTVYVFLMSDGSYYVHEVESGKSARRFAWSSWNKKRDSASATPKEMIGKWHSEESSYDCYDKVWLYSIIAFDTPYPAPPATNNHIVRQKVYTRNRFDSKDTFLLCLHEADLVVPQDQVDLAQLISDFMAAFTQHRLACKPAAELGIFEWLRTERSDTWRSALWEKFKLILNNLYEHDEIGSIYRSTGETPTVCVSVHTMHYSNSSLR
jgi:hypothetical protein